MKTLLKIFNWPRSISIAIIIWCVFFAAFAIYSGNFKSDLVKQDYYEDQEMLNIKTKKITNSTDKIVKISNDQQQNLLEFKFPPSEDFNLIKGKVTFYRPSDQDQDRIYEVILNEIGTQNFSTNELIPGFWRVIIEWKNNEMEFMQKEQLIIK